MTAFQWLSPELSSRLCLTLLHSLWQAALLALAVWVVERVWSKRTVEWRYGLNVAAIVLCVAAVPITFAFVESEATTASAEREPILAAESTSTAEGVPKMDPLMPRVVVVELPGGGLVVPPHLAEKLTHRRGTHDDLGAAWTRFAPWIAWVYVGGVCLMLVRLISNIVRAEQLRSTARPITSGPLVDALEALVRQWSMRVTPALAVAERIAVPTLVGVLKPTILLPVSAMSGLSTTELRMILAHELAHVRRHDMWVNLVQRLAEVVLFFNPAVWFLSRRTSRLREFCCDEMACRELSNLVQEPRIRYAEALVHVVELAGRTKARQLDLVGQSAKGRSPSELRRRLARLLGEPLREPIRVSRAGLLSLSVLTVALVLAPLAKSYSEEAADGDTLSFPEERAVGVVQSRPADAEKPKTSLAVRVHSADGGPVPHVYINLWRESGPQETDGVFWEDRATGTRWLRTGSANPNDGRHGWNETEFRFESLEPGRYRVTAVPYHPKDEVPDPTPYGISEPVVYDGTKPQTIDVNLASGESALAVRVIDQESGEPLSGVGLRLRDSSGAPIVHGHGSGNFFERTGENGEVRFGSLKAGNYTVEVFGKNARVNQFDEYAPLASPVEITLAKGEKLQEIAIAPRHLEQAEIDRRFPYSAYGQVVDADGNPLEGVEVRAATGMGTLRGGGSVKTGADGRYKLYFGPGVMMQHSEHAPRGIGLQAAHFWATLPGWKLVGNAEYYELLMSDLTPEQITEQIRRDGKVWGRDNTEDVIFANQPRELNFKMQRDEESKEAEVSR